jgi:hypothetical protein
MNPLTRLFGVLAELRRQVQGAVETDYVATSLRNQRELLDAVEALAKAVSRMQEQITEIEGELRKGGTTGNTKDQGHS